MKQFAFILLVLLTNACQIQDASKKESTRLNFIYYHYYFDGKAKIKSRFTDIVQYNDTATLLLRYYHLDENFSITMGSVPDDTITITESARYFNIGTDIRLPKPSIDSCIVLDNSNHYEQICFKGIEKLASTENQELYKYTLKARPQEDGLDESLYYSPDLKCIVEHVYYLRNRVYNRVKLYEIE